MPRLPISYIVAYISYHIYICVVVVAVVVIDRNLLKKKI